ncbi:MAG: transposase [Lachnospiraceae bacterium]|nr:transposase [Lachnospiraceae bacterium]
MKRLFTPEEIELLEKNIYTYKVSDTMIKFTDDFRDDFWKLYLTDMPVKEIFSTLGYDAEMLGTKRTDGFVYNLRKERLTNEQRLDSISRTSKVRRPPSDVKYSEMKSKEAIKAMEIELTYLRQEVNF